MSSATGIRGSVRHICAIWRREMRSYFFSPVAYVVFTMVLLMVGIAVWWGFSLYQQQSIMNQQTQYGMPSIPVNANLMIIRLLFPRHLHRPPIRLRTLLRQLLQTLATPSSRGCPRTTSPPSHNEHTNPKDNIQKICILLHKIILI